MQLFLAGDDSEVELRAELTSLFPLAEPRLVQPLIFELPDPLPGSELPHIAFARQWFPNAQAAGAESIGGWVRHLFNAILPHIPDGQPWRLHVEPHYGARAVRRIGARAWHSSTLRRAAHPVSPGRHRSEHIVEAGAGRHRCRLIREGLIELLGKRRRQLLRHWEEDPAPFAPETSCVQALLTAPTSGFISVAVAPLPLSQRHLLSPFPKGEVVVPADPDAPSRAFAKLVEAELRLGRSIQPGEICVDLGASPGSWTYVAASRGARVVAVDRSPLRADVAAQHTVEFFPGDAFKFRPRAPVDWLLCDVIAPPEKTAILLLDWLSRRWTRHFVVTIKLKDQSGLIVLEDLKRDLAKLCSDFRLTHLCVNKKEVCAFGTADPRASNAVMCETQRPNRLLP